MKKIRKLFALALALTLALSLSLPALAATVTVPTSDLVKDHTFTAYQIFSGTQDDNSGATLGGVQWGSGINGEDFLAALQADSKVSQYFDVTVHEAADVAVALSKITNDSAALNHIAQLALDNKKGNGQELQSGDNVLADGYYLIVDESSVSGDNVKNAALLRVTRDIVITAKTDKPSVEKKVEENVKYPQDGGYGNKFNDVADYNMGDSVDFKLIGSVPDMTYYDTYKYIFHDTMSAGLTLTENSIKVYAASDKKGTDKAEITGWTKSVDGQSFTVSFNDLKTVAVVAAGKYIIVEYSAVLNQSAEVGLPGNPNEVYLEYSNNPDQSGEGETNPTGETPKDKVIVFTYELDTTKVDGTDSTVKLKDAEFVLYRTTSDGRRQYVKVDADSKVIGWTAAVDADAEVPTEASKLTSAETTGLFKVIGLDDGTYYLKETKAPAGYNLLTSDIAVVINATTNNGQNWNDFVPDNALTMLDVTADRAAGTGNVDTGIAGITVANNKGAQLPETGGMGTTIFYVAGAVLMLSAVILLVTKKKMQNR